MKIIFEEDIKLSKQILEMMQMAAHKALELEGLDEDTEERMEISLSFVEPEEIREINSQFRQIDKVTDVLSFPQFNDFDEFPEVGEIVLGDVVICIDRAKEQAQEFGHSLEREIVYLFVHSILHLLGYDHMEEDEKKVMRAREEEVMAFIDLPR